MRFVRQGLWLGLCLLLGCYRWTHVPQGVSQELLDLQVDGLLQRYTCLMPGASIGSQTRRHPAVLVLHSGFSGDEATSADLARTLAQRGFVVVLPAYRGEIRRADGKRSEGKVEFCRGEVNDAYAGLDWLRRHPGVDSARIGVLGMSHGGCIALRLAQRAPELRALVTMSAPVAAQPLIEHLESTPFQMFFYNGILAGQLRGYVQTQPAQQAMAFAERSPVQAAMQLHMPMLVLHGTEDQMVPVEQACWLRQSLRASGRVVLDYQIDAAGRLNTLKMNPCAAETVGIEKESAASPAQFVLLEKEDHIYSRAAQKAAHRLALEFLQRELRPAAATIQK